MRGRGNVKGVGECVRRGRICNTSNNKCAHIRKRMGLETIDECMIKKRLHAGLEQTYKDSKCH